MSPIRKLLLGVTGGIAAYKSAEFVRLARKREIEVQVVMTEAATRFVAPMTFEALSGNRVLTSLWTGEMAHIDLGRDYDAILVAPASADFLAKAANGFADDLLSTLCLARDIPLMVAPAMNRMMWNNPATQRNIESLTRDGVRIFGPDQGSLACGEVGPGRMLEPAQLLQLLSAALTPKRLAGKKVLITAGPTLEAIDPVRAITNLSSGKMGYAIAAAAIDSGATVALISGPTCLDAPAGCEYVQVASAMQMQREVMERAETSDVFIGVAAVSDYRVANYSPQKIKKTGEKIVIELEPNPDILAGVARLENGPYCVGFAAETENLEQYASAKRRSKNVPLLVGNSASFMGSDENELILFEESGQTRLPRAPKSVLAARLIEAIADRIKAR